MPKHFLVEGHTLRNEGVCYEGGYLTPIGRALCSCGWQSEELDTNAKRKKAHRQHKMDVLAGRETGD